MAEFSEQVPGSRGGVLAPRAVLVLGGGPDAEREVSLLSSAAITDALNAWRDAQGRAGFVARREVIERLALNELRSLCAKVSGEAGTQQADGPRATPLVVFPALHGGWGEGGQLQDLLETLERESAASGLPLCFVGSRARAARQAMDKVSTKLVATRLGVPTPEAWVLDHRDPSPPGELPLIIKPIHEGSTIGLHICRTKSEWDAARARIQSNLRTQPAQGSSGAAAGGGSYLVEAMVGDAARPARELTVGMLDGMALPVIEILPAEGSGRYDYEAKYTREDTRYVLDPKLTEGVRERVQDQTLRIARALGVRHLARADFMLDGHGTAWFLEINTMPGFTSHSLVPMAARHMGVQMPELCARLIHMALRDLSASPRTGAPPLTDPCTACAGV